MHAEFRHVDRNLAGSLHRVRVQRDACFSRDFADLCNRLNRAQLVIRKHNCDQHGLRANRPANVFGIHDSVAVDRQEGHGDPAFFERPARVQYRAVFNRGCNDVLAAA